MTRQLTRVGLLAATGLTFLTACGSASGQTARVASVGDTSATATSDTTAAAGSGDEGDAQQAMLDFAACMREHGIDMPDPQFSGDGAGGNLVFSAGAAPGGDGPGTMDMTKMEDAQKACQSFLDKVQSNMPPPDPAKMEEERQKFLAFAQCMRDHGIDFPDPEINTDGGGLQVKVGGPGMNPDSPGFKEANDACATEAGLPKMGEAPAGSAGFGLSTGSADGKSNS